MPQKYVKKTEHVFQPLDIEILRLLPDEGAMIGFANLGAPSKGIREELSVKGGVPLDGSLIGGRLRELRRFGYIVSVPILPQSISPGYQVTAKGKQKIEEGI